MTPPIRIAALGEVQWIAAELMLGASADGPVNVGEISLWPHQRDAVSRLRAAIVEFGGALLADDVGTGKTFVALAVATAYDAPLVVAPAALRERWRDAASRAGRVIAFISIEALSRGATIASGHDFVIVDEAHHARNPATKRYGALASLMSNRPALLLTATPIHNRRSDLLALLALFCGSAAYALDHAALARCVVRRGREVFDGAASLPRVHGPIPIHCQPESDDTPAAILALPPPVPAADAGVASTLLAISLLRQWSSSQGALLAAIRRRLATAHALASTLDDGHYPTRAELAAWTSGDDAQQVVMPTLLAPPASAPGMAELRVAVAEHIAGLRELRRVASGSCALDARRAALFRDVWHFHPGARAIAFTQFAGTVDSYWRELRHVPGVCALTAEQGRIASGPIARAEALGSLAPGRPERPSPAFHIGALLVTDLASEGLDLQAASVLVHLDLPWTPARLEQRVGRIVRPGAPHDVVHVYAMEPPLSPTALLDIRRALTAKLAAARETLGSVMPDVGLLLGGAGDVDREAPAVPASTEAGRRILARWRSSGEGRHRESGDSPVAAVASGNSNAWLAVIGDREPRLVAALGDNVTDDPAIVARVIAMIDASSSGDRRNDHDASRAIARARAQLDGWLDARRGAALAGVDDIGVVAARRRALAAVARLASAPASARVLDARSARRALSIAARPLGAALERDLRAITRSPASGDAALLDAVAHLAPDSPSRNPAADSSLRALVVLAARG